MVTWLAARVWSVLVAVICVVGVAHLGVSSGLTWHYVQTGVREMFSRRALHVYADHPEVQMGPLTLVAAAPFVVILPALLGRLVMMAVLSGAGLFCLQQVTVLAGTKVRTDGRLILALGVLFLPVWMEVAVHWEHPDDAIALLCAILALRLAREEHWVASAALLALAADFKPWALAFVPLLLMSPRRWWLLSIGTWTVVVVAAWAPFVLGDRLTIARISAFTIRNDQASVLRVFGIDTATTPSWCRAAQLVGGAVLAVLLVRHGRWQSALLAVIAYRLLLDPGTKNYYDAGVVLGAALFDVTIGRHRWTRATIITMLLIYLPSYLLMNQPELRGWLRAVGLFALLILISWQRAPAETAGRSTGCSSEIR